MCDQIIALSYSRWPTSESWKKAIEGCLYFTLGEQFTYSMVLSRKSKFWKILWGLFVHMAWKKICLFKHLLSNTGFWQNLQFYILHIYHGMPYLSAHIDVPSSTWETCSSLLNLSKCCFIHTRLNSWFCHLTVELPWVNPWTFLSPTSLSDKWCWLLPTLWMTIGLTEIMSMKHLAHNKCFIITYDFSITYHNISSLLYCRHYRKVLSDSLCRHYPLPGLNSHWQAPAPLLWRASFLTLGTS